MKDDCGFIRKLPSHVDCNSVLRSCDAVRLSMSVSHDLGLQTLSYLIDWNSKNANNNVLKNLLH